MSGASPAWLSLRGRLLASYAFVAVVTLIVVVGALSVLLAAAVTRQEFDQLAQLGRFGQRLLVEQNGRGGTSDELRSALADLAVEADVDGLRLLVLNGAGTIMVDSQARGGLEGRPFVVAGGQPVGRPGPMVPPARGRYVAPDGAAYRYVSMASQVPRGRAGWALLVVAQPEVSWFSPANELGQRLALASLIALALAALVALVMARSLYRPIARLTAASEAMARGEYAQQVVPEGPPELAGLARAFNRMADEVRASRLTTQEFVANVSHELRTPLTSIRGFVEALGDGTVTDEAGRERSLAIIANELRRLQRLVNSLLDLSRIESGQADLQRAPVELAGVLRQCAEIFAVRAEEAGVMLEVAAPPIGPTVVGDADRLEQVLANLLDNALRYTPAGGRVRLGLESVGGRAVVTVADSGAGIPARALPHLFERFYTADPARAGGGAGLGLAIAREIALAHGGDLTVESRLGQGSRFTLTLPVAAPVPAARLALR